MHEQGTLIAEETNGIAVRRVVRRLEGIQPVEVVPSVVATVIAPIDVVVSFSIHAIDVEGMTAEIHVMTCIDDGAPFFQFMSQHSVPTTGGVENAVEILSHAVTESTMQGFHGPIDVCTRGPEAIVHVHRHSSRQTGEGYGVALGWGPSIAIVQEIVAPVESGTGQHIRNRIVVRLPTEEGVLQDFGIAIESHHLLNGGCNTSAKTTGLTDCAVLGGPLGTQQVIGLLLCANGLQQGTDGGSLLNLFPPTSPRGSKTRRALILHLP